MNIVFWVLVVLVAFAFWYLMCGQFKLIGFKATDMFNKVKKNISDDEVEVRDEQR